MRFERNHMPGKQYILDDEAASGIVGNFVGDHSKTVREGPQLGRGRQHNDQRKSHI